MSLQWLLVVAGSLFLVLFTVRRFVNASAATMARGLRTFALVTLVAFGLLLIVAGRLPWQTAIVVLLLPVAIFFLTRGSGTAAGQKSATGRRSEVTTRFLRMILDHDTGELDGTVLHGTFAWRALSSMSLDELRSLVAEISVDADSLNVLATYLDRIHGETWRETTGGTGGHRPAAPAAAMTRDEAYKILGLAPGAGEGQIRAAHRKLMKLSHPDHGGSDYLASKINEAKDFLLGDRKGNGP